MCVQIRVGVSTCCVSRTMEGAGAQLRRSARRSGVAGPINTPNAGISSTVDTTRGTGPASAFEDVQNRQASDNFVRTNTSTTNNPILIQDEIRLAGIDSAQITAGAGFIPSSPISSTALASSAVYLSSQLQLAFSRLFRFRISETHVPHSSPTQYAPGFVEHVS